MFWLPTRYFNNASWRGLSCNKQSISQKHSKHYRSVLISIYATENHYPRLRFADYNRLIGRRVRELDTFCEILPYNKFPHDDPSVIGVILSGSPFSVYDPEAFQVDLSKIRSRLPILGICYGAQYMSHIYGGKVEPANTREYGRANLTTFEHENPLFRDFHENSQVWMSHGDTITAIPEGFRCIASTPQVKYAALSS